MKFIEILRENKALFFILVVAAILRLYHIDFQSIWMDEIHTINEASPDKSFSEVHDALMTSEPHPPLFFFLIHILFKIFGYTTLVARVFVAIVGIAGVFSIYLLGKEIFSRKAGLIAAVLLAVNYFHLYYSQDARMYGLLFLMTTLSFYYLVKFIKKPTLKAAIIYGVFSALMIYCHFFGLFALFAQYLILLYFVIIPFEIDRKKFLSYCFLSGVITFILYLPTYNLFIKTTEMTSIWIKMPTLDVFTQFFKDFFGESEIVVFFVSILIVLFFIQLSKAKNSDNLRMNPYNDKLVFTFFVFFVWILATLALPLIRTYTSLPMLINRYFINILPAILITIAIGLSSIKNKIVSYGVLSVIIIFSFIDIVVVKKYYTVPNKAQFREATNFIKSNNTNKEPVVTSLGWYMPFFLKNGKTNFEIIEKPLDVYFDEMQQDSTKIKPFWYIDGHDRVYSPNEKSLAFINTHFYIENNYDGFQAWAKHFILLKDVPKTIDLSKFKKIEQINGDVFKFNLESYQFTNNIVAATGWAFFEGHDAVKTEINLVLIKEGVATRLQTQKVMRKDIAEYFKSDFELSNSGFTTTADISKFEEGNYQLAIYLVNNKNKKEGLVLTDKIIIK